MTAPRFAIRRPRLTLLLAAALLLAALPGLDRLQLRTDGRTLVPERDAGVATDRDVRRRYDLRDPIVVVLRGDQAHAVYDPDALQWVAELTRDLAAFDGVRPQDITSLATETGLRFEERGLGYRTLLDPLPRTEAELARLRDELERIGLYLGTVVARDGSAAAVVLATPARADRLDLYRQVRARAEQRVPEGWDVDVLGAPVAEALLGAHILADLGVPESWLGIESVATGSIRRGLVLWAIALMGLVFLVAFRRPAAALMPLAEAGGCLLLVFGAMGWFGAPIYIPTVVLPVILTAVGVADEIHIFRCYLMQVRSAAGSSQQELVGETMEQMAPPVLRTSLTTAAAFLSFTLSPLAPVRLFGLFTAAGVLACLAWSLTVVPACLVLLPKGWWVATPTGRDVGAPFAALARIAARRRAAVVVIAATLAIAAAVTTTRLRVQDSWEAGFDARSELARATAWFDDHFLGSHQLLVEVGREPAELSGSVGAADLEPFALRLPAVLWPRPEELVGSDLRVFALTSPRTPTEPPREWRTWVEGVEIEGDRLVLTMPRQRGSARAWIRPSDEEEIGYELRSEPYAMPGVLRLVADLEAFLRSRDGVGGVLGPATYLETVGFVLRPESEASRRLPDRPDLARIRWNNYTRIRGRERLVHLVDERYAHGVVSAYVGGSNYEATRRLIAEVRDWAQEHLEPHHLVLRFAGDLAVSTRLVRGVVDTQLRSLALSLALILLIAGAMFRRFDWGLLCVVPPLLAILFNFAIMAAIGMPLGVATSMFAGMTLGVGVDFAIHLLSRYRRELDAGAGREESLAQALRFAGPAIAVDAAAVGIGFGVLMLSSVPGNARLGALLSLSVLHCLLASLLLLPALLPLLAYRPRTPPS